MRQLPYVLLVTLALIIVATNVTAADVPQWTPTDISFKAASVSVNPFMVPFSATVKGPGGNELTLPGFYDGAGTWKIRVSPTAEGKWTLVTKSELKELDGQRSEFTCVKNLNANVHGVLRVDKKHPHHFIYDDGTRLFMQGYEYDWLWALDMDQPGVPTVEKSLDILAQHGFNYVILNSYAHDTKWREGKSSDDDYGGRRSTGNCNRPTISLTVVGAWHSPVMNTSCFRMRRSHSRWRSRVRNQSSRQSGSTRTQGNVPLLAN